MGPKKWFIYVGDHHEGPFSPEEIRQKLSAGEVQAGTYVWTEGFPEWKPINQVPELTSSGDAEKTLTGLRSRPAAAPAIPTSSQESLAGDLDSKVWGISLKGQFSGPHSARDVAAMLSRGQITSADMVWREGWKNWAALSTVPELAALQTSAPAGVAAMPGENAPSPDVHEPTLGSGLMRPSSHTGAIQAPANPTSTQTPRPSPVASQPAPGAVNGNAPVNTSFAPDATRGSGIPTGEKTGVSRFIKRSKPTAGAPFSGEVLAGPEGDPGGGVRLERRAPAPQKAGPVRRMFRFFFIVLLPILIFVGAGGGYLVMTQNELLDYLPLPSFMSLIPPLEDVSADDLVELKMAARKNLANGASLTIVKKSDDDFNPSFYAATNLPDGVVFDVELTGLPGTLINALTYQQSVRAEVKNRLLQTPRFSSGQGKPLPRGEYLVRIYDSKNQPQGLADVVRKHKQKVLPLGVPQDRSVYTQKTIFVGGVKDKNYQKRLSEYIAKVEKQFTNELTELKQFVSNIEMLYQDSISTYDQAVAIKKKKDSQAKWDTFEKKWSGFYTSMEDSIRKYTPEQLRQTLYPETFTELQTLTTRLNQLHTMQTALMAGKTPDDVKALGEGRSYEEASKAFKESLDGIKKKVDELGNNPPLPQLANSFKNAGAEKGATP